MDDDMDKLSLFADTVGGGAAVNKRRGEDLVRVKIAAQENQRLRRRVKQPPVISCERGCSTEEPAI